VSEHVSQQADSKSFPASWKRQLPFAYLPPHGGKNAGQQAARGLFSKLKRHFFLLTQAQAYYPRG